MNSAGHDDSSSTPVAVGSPTADEGDDSAAEEGNASSTATSSSSPFRRQQGYRRLAANARCIGLIVMCGMFIATFVEGPHRRDRFAAAYNHHMNPNRHDYHHHVLLEVLERGGRGKDIGADPFSSNNTTTANIPSGTLSNHERAAEEMSADELEEWAERRRRRSQREERRAASKLTYLAAEVDRCRLVIASADILRLRYLALVG